MNPPGVGFDQLAQALSISNALIRNAAPEEWYESYLNYIESLKTFNSQIRETIIVATMISEDKTNDVPDVIEKIDSLKKDFEALAKASDQSRP